MMKTPTRQRLIDAAVRRFYRDGFRNVGIDQVLADVGISKQGRLDARRLGNAELLAARYALHDDS